LAPTLAELDTESEQQKVVLVFSDGCNIKKILLQSISSIIRRLIFLRQPSKPGHGTGTEGSSVFSEDHD
jgi:hypothetical protein